MPALYRKISTRIWSDAKFRALSRDARYVLLFLLTHPQMTMLGAMRANVAGMAAESGMERGEFEQALAQLVAPGIARYDDAASFLFLPNFLKHNQPGSPNCVRAWPAVFESLPECDLRAELADRVSAAIKELPKSFQAAFSELAKDMPEPFTKTSTGSSRRHDETLQEELKKVFLNQELGTRSQEQELGAGAGAGKSKAKSSAKSKVEKVTALKANGSNGSQEAKALVGEVSSSPENSKHTPPVRERSSRWCSLHNQEPLLSTADGKWHCETVHCATAARLNQRREDNLALHSTRDVEMTTGDAR